MGTGRARCGLTRDKNELRGYLRRVWRGKKIGYERFESVRGDCSSVKI